MMDKTTGSVLKAESVNMQGSVRLDIGRPPQKPAPAAGTSAAGVPQVRIVEKKPEFAVIEVTCSCGTKTRIRCDYGQQ